MCVYKGTVKVSLMMDPLWSETCCTTFKYLITLIISTYYILCISWIIKCLIIIDARCKHEDCIPCLEFAIGNKNTSLVCMVTSHTEMFVFSGRKMCLELNGATYFASRASANTPAASGAAALVPEWVVVHFPYRSVVACQTQFCSMTNVTFYIFTQQI